MSEPTKHTEDHRRMPTLVLRELPDGQVTGVVMWETRSSYQVRFAGDFVEPEEVERGLEILRRLEPDTNFGTWKKAANIDAASLDDAIASAPETQHGQKYVVPYRDHEWLWDIWNNPSHPGRVPAVAGLHLTSIADFHGTRVSAVKRTTRSGLSVVRAGKTIPGDYDVLETALFRFQERQLRARDKQDYEAHPAVRCLCDWWNSQAPDGSREAAVVRLYAWNDENRIFDACDLEEPSALAGQVVAWPSYTLFEQADMPTVLACFYRGRQFNVGMPDGCTTVFAADGSAAVTIGLSPNEVDEAYYSLAGIEELAAVPAFC